MAKAKKEQGTKKLTLLSTVEHDGESYKAGDDLELPEDQAEALIKGGAAKAAGKAAEETKPE